MADTVANATIFQTKTELVVRSQFTIDGTEAADLVLVDKSTFTGPDGTEPSKFVLEKMWYSVVGCQILVEFDAASDHPIATLQGDGWVDFTDGGRFHGYVDPTTGGTGDIIATTLNTDLGDTATILLVLRKKD